LVEIGSEIEMGRSYLSYKEKRWKLVHRFF